MPKPEARNRLPHGQVVGYHLRADPWKEERYSAQETDAMQRMRAESARRRRAGA